MAALPQDMVTDLTRRVADLEQRIKAISAERDKSLAQQSATTDVFQVINSSPANLAPVFDAILERAMRLCEAPIGVLWTYDGQYMRASASRGAPPAYAEFLEHGPIRPSHIQLQLLDRSDGFVQVADLALTEGYRIGNSLPRAAADLGGIRTLLVVSLRKHGVLLGTFGIYRQEVRPFSDRQVALVQSFAAQAVIAIENARLFNEVEAKTRDLSEALEHQTATSEILRVISQSPTDVQPVFDAIVQTAVRLIRCDIAFVLRCDGATFSPAAAAGPDGPLPDLGPSHLPIDPGANFPSRAIVGKKNVHLPDWSLIDLPEHERQIQALIGVNSALFLPLLREAECIGVLALAGKQANIFGESEIALAELFRDQALIAIENARLFNETKQALERQTATADVLKIISRSVSHAEPVFDTILEFCQRLFDPYDAAIYLVDGELVMGVARRGSETAEWGTDSMPLKGSSTGLAIAQRRALHFPDLADKADLPEDKRATVKEAGGMSVLYAPMISGSRGIGSLVVTRRPKKPFTEIEIEFIQSFADQAVIAIENSRLFGQVQTRTRELEQSLHDLRKAQDMLVQTEKLASLGQLTAGIAHEIKNPLNFVNNFSALSAELTDELNGVLKPAPLTDKLRQEVDELTGLLKDNLEKVVQHGKRADFIVKNMLLHSREGSGEQRAADINALLDESLNLAYHGARAEKPGFNITLQRDFDPNAGMIELFPQEMTRAFLNLIANGFYAASKRIADSGDPDFEPVLSAATKNLGNHVEICIRDNGTGIPPEVREKIFNPFFTTKPAGEGTGLGLSMSHDIIVKQHGGRIEVDTQPGQFTEFIIVLPRASNLASNRKN